ncbi:tetratricopeptide repeat protein [Fructilactobacillus vespulae]|uniref:tetratricopeptide repeat protein n=1 Tax=Fructilactobacillus vespulae TaxID=1249630 RepID=UPI0039B4C3E5
MTFKKEADKQKQTEETLHKLVKDIDDNPHDYHTYYDLSVFLIQLQSYTQAEELLMKALGLFADRSKKAKNTLTYGLGNVYYSAGETNKAIQQFQQVTDKSLQFDAYVMLAQSYMAQNDYKRALIFLLTAQPQAKQDESLNLLIGQCLLAEGDFAQAANYYEKVLKSNPDQKEANFSCGLIAMTTDGDYKTYFNKVEQLDPVYFKEQQSKIADIEKFIQIRDKKK